MGHTYRAEQCTNPTPFGDYTDYEFDGRPGDFAINCINKQRLRAQYETRPETTPETTPGTNDVIVCTASADYVSEKNFTKILSPLDVKDNGEARLSFRAKFHDKCANLISEMETLGTKEAGTKEVGTIPADTSDEL